ncbi:MAG: hypothetical protein QNK11_00570, partial [Legionella sp.]|nr:hypothetical protein [Legionella sp.]
MPRLRHIASGILLLASQPMYADDSSETLSEYLKNLSGYLGFDVSQEPSAPLATLINISAATLVQQYSFVTLLGAIPVNSYSEAFAYFVPPNTKDYALINDMANYAFQRQANSATYSDPSASTSGGGVSVSALIDQEAYQKDPVSQSVLNILTTPQT